MVVRYRAAIKDLPGEMRPRERLAAQGVETLTESELLALLLGSGYRDKSALELADELLIHHHGLRFVKTMSYEELRAVKGIGEAKASRLQAAAELGRRLARQTLDSDVITGPEDAARLVMEDMRFLDREHFRCLLLNRKNRVLSQETISVGGLSSSAAHPREIFKPAIQRSAASVILVHNHPSGDPTPSADDIEITKRLTEAGRLLGIDVLDHLIIGDGRYVSLKSMNLLL
ncbi:MAG: RadC family protein [Solirubrobacterales bacterium]